MTGLALDGGCPTPGDNVGRMNSARCFVRREDDEPPRIPPDSPFRHFNVSCLKCGSYRLTLTTNFDEMAGEQRLLLTCSRCHQNEVLQVHLYKLWPHRNQVQHLLYYLVFSAIEKTCPPSPPPVAGISDG